jgi:hypothetical protein
MEGPFTNEPMVYPISEGPLPCWQENVDRVRHAMEDILILLYGAQLDG